MARSSATGPGARMVAGAAVMLAAIALQFALVLRLLEPSIALSLAGYVALFIGMGIAVSGVLAQR